MRAPCCCAVPWARLRPATSMPASRSPARGSSGAASPPSLSLWGCRPWGPCSGGRPAVDRSGARPTSKPCSSAVACNKLDQHGQCTPYEPQSCCILVCGHRQEAVRSKASGQVQAAPDSTRALICSRDHGVSQVTPMTSPRCMQHRQQPAPVLHRSGSIPLRPNGGTLGSSQ